MQEQGFFYLINYGVDEAEITRQVNIGHTVLSTTPQEEKAKLRSQMQEDGNYKGFKLKGYYMGAGGTPDRIEQFNWSVYWRSFAFSMRPNSNITAGTVT